MRTVRFTFVLLVCASAVSAFAASDAQQVFNGMKALVGSWEGKAPDGQPISTKYELAAGGTSLMEESSEDHMVTMFYLVGDRLVLTHYCGSGTQPHMQASILPDGKTIAFEFIDGTNIPTVERGHMHRAVFTLIDHDHYTEEWTWMQDGKSAVMHADMHRKQ